MALPRPRTASRLMISELFCHLDACENKADAQEVVGNLALALGFRSFVRCAGSVAGGERRHGRPADGHLSAMGVDGTATLLLSGGTELPPEHASVAELEDRESDPAPAAQP